MLVKSVQITKIMPIFCESGGQNSDYLGERYGPQSWKCASEMAVTNLGAPGLIHRLIQWIKYVMVAEHLEISAFINLRIQMKNTKGMGTTLEALLSL